MNGIFEVAGGSILGRDHRNTNRNNHDAFHIVSEPDITIGVVCDGCGSGLHSEVGAKIAAKMITEQILIRHRTHQFFSNEEIHPAIRRVQRSVLSHIQVLADSMSGSFSKIIEEYFLFTVIGFVITKERAFTFAVGDGYIFTDGRMTELSSLDNRPEYLAYGLVDSKIPSLGLKIITCQNMRAIESILVGTDGLTDFLGAIDEKLPGKEERVGPVSQFWQKDRYFRNTFAIQRRFNLMNRPSQSIDYETRCVNQQPGLLSDDTTIVVARRKTS